MAVLVLPFLDAAVRDLFRAPDVPAVDFTAPCGEPALVPPASVSWRVFKNPVSLFIGGVAAVILELAEPAVRTGVWEHTSLHSDPGRRLRRTTMRTTCGCSLGFRRQRPALRRDLCPLCQTPGAARARSAAARLYGALDMPTSKAGVEAVFDSMQPRLEASLVVHEFLDIMPNAPVLPAALRPAQRLLVRVAIDMTPGWMRERLGLLDDLGLARWQRRLVCRAGALADRLVMPSSPAVQSCRRLGLPADYLYGNAVPVLPSTI